MNAKTSFFNRKIFSENVRRILPFALIVLVIEILLLINNLRNIFTTDFFTQEMTAKTVNILSMIKSTDIYVSHTNTATARYQSDLLWHFIHSAAELHVFITCSSTK